MVMRFIYGSPIEDEVGRLTSEDVPNHELDMTDALNFADKIRSKEYNAKDVARALQTRLGYPNPNVQILVLNLADICVKNGGTLVQLEISRREFIDSIVGTLDSKTGRDHELRQLVLKLVQEWAALFRGNNEMSYVSGVMERMRRSGYSFPKSHASTSNAMIDTASAPEWEDSPVCQRCRTQFTFTNRKHHCRNCGKCFCNDCSSNTTTIPRFAIYEPVRVCHGCYLRLKKIVPDIEGGDGLPKRTDSYRSQQRYTPPSNTTTPDVPDDDEDLKRAIELSLQESQNKPNYADYTLQGRQSTATTSAAASSFAPPAATTTRPSQAQYPTVTSEPYPLISAPTNVHNIEEEEEDPDLRAAIEASLRDVPGGGAVPDYPQVADSARTAPHQYQLPASDPEDDMALAAFMPAVEVEEENDNPLSVTEGENVKLFESLLERIQESGQDIRYDPQIQYLHESIEQLHPKITGAMENVDQKHKEFIKLHDRIITAIKIYDQLLDKRLRSSTFTTASSAAPVASSYYPSQQSIYPAVPGQQANFEGAAPPQYPSSSTNPAFNQQSQVPPPAQQHHQLPQHQAPQAAPMYNDTQAVQARSLYQQQSPVPAMVANQAPQSTYMPANTMYSASPGNSSAMLAPPLDAGFVQQPGALAAHASPTHLYSAPPPVTHVPSIPVLQPATKTSTAQTPSTAPSAAPAPNVSSEPEEAPLIEF
ncbi:Vacuolar protein-sorting-associated protein 27 [Coemansia guatemalensis]|uniref:Vacuolar protein sorting-associated protein 27 n=1 Tax=Coemansia guatemalensis TaxID=2761395 RepID=A0A9W8LS61_9FUNG|nr:Vacuolar protein-sorting-associated protein 27 [Coemansia guatemalensis]